MKLKGNSEFYPIIFGIIEGNERFYNLTREVFNKIVFAPTGLTFTHWFLASHYPAPPEVTVLLRCTEPTSKFWIIDAPFDLISPVEKAGHESRILRSVWVSVDEYEEQTSVFEKPFYLPIN